MDKFKVGDKVVLSKVGREAYRDARNNPHSGIGKVEELRNHSNFYYGVRWENESGNNYRPEDLELHQENPWLECLEGYTEADNHEVSYFMGVPTHYREVEPEVEAVEERVKFEFDGMGCIFRDHVEPYCNATIKGQMLEGKPMGQWIITMDEGNYDAWFRGKVEEALNNTKPSKPHAEVMQSLRATVDEV